MSVVERFRAIANLAALAAIAFFLWRRGWCAGLLAAWVVAGAFFYDRLARRR